MKCIQDFSLFLWNLMGSWALDLKGTQIMHFDLQMYPEPLLQGNMILFPRRDRASRES